MKNFLIALLATLFVMLTTTVTKPKEVRHDPAPIKRQSIIQPLQAKAYAHKQPVAPVAPKASPVASTSVSGTCEDWMRQAGITDIPTALWLVQHESGCRSTAQNPHSTAYGIFQFLDSTWAGAGCTKTSDPVQQMVCGQRYVNNRYGGWSGAKAFWQSHRWF